MKGFSYIIGFDYVVQRVLHDLRKMKNTVLKSLSVISLSLISNCVLIKIISIHLNQ